ncbi:hypothetical protein KEM52_002779 [Ascosphaera acerosa]|nr:hypothetical protein KEM52_002779 [Ascosphaera acerosa]
MADYELLHNKGKVVKSTLIDLNPIGGKQTRFSNYWLRENCPSLKHPETQQRQVDPFLTIPLDIVPDEVRTFTDRVEIDWIDGHKSVYDTQWLKNHQHGVRQLPKTESGRCDAVFRRDAKFVKPDSDYRPIVEYDEHKYGFAFVKGAPATPEATERLIRRIAFIRETHYGGFWDFTADLAKKDMAYTTLPIGAHTDTTYFTDPARLQMFHLLSHTNGSGGESLLIDGFEAARRLLREDPLAYRILSGVQTVAHASGNEDAMIKPAVPFPVLNHDPVTDELFQVRWNSEDRAPQNLYGVTTMNAWYVCAKKWSDILSRPDMQMWFQLEPGMPMIFDNWRMLHGRSEFVGKRRLCGAYINNDDFQSRLNILTRGRKQLLKEL